ncbi:acyl-CoA thioesterase [Sphingobium sp. TKS]|uniref:acyl-CoA thioesterase n=1 Tax=Sphingobium sp. TKS TaxID=1315974 RepID=UPI00076FE1B6|nr:thioesterase family protein [Sphingobium sp. TKS]AMK23225.1 thioesterase superfamily protein [Sphingobium sp. TKS]
MTFVSRQTVRFAHVDPAGIVFYPRYFEMLNAAVEDYFAEAVGVDFATMHLERHLGVPTVKLETEFAAPSRLGDALDFLIEVTRVGRSSADVAVEVRCGAETRLRIAVVLVCMDLKTGRPVAWPADMRPIPAAEAA